MNLLSRALICLASAGWLLPATASLRIYLHCCDNPAWRMENSAPLLSISGGLASMASGWLFVTILYWTWRATDPKK